MLLAEHPQSFYFVGSPIDSKAMSTGSLRSRSISSLSTRSSNAPLRLADVAKEHGMGVHVENWREDMFPIRQYLPMQHIIGSLKRDRDEQVSFIDDAAKRSPHRFRTNSELAAASPRSEDSFLQVLRTPKRRRTSTCSHTLSTCTTDSDPDRRFSWQAAEHKPLEISPAALPGLNHALNLTTITADERDIFAEYAPKHLEDPQILMGEVLQLRDRMMEEVMEDDEEDDDRSLHEVAVSPIIPPERDEEVRHALQTFIKLSDLTPQR